MGCRNGSALGALSCRFKKCVSSFKLHLGFEFLELFRSLWFLYLFIGKFFVSRPGWYGRPRCSLRAHSVSILIRVASRLQPLGQPVLFDRNSFALLFDRTSPTLTLA